MQWGAEKSIEGFNFISSVYEPYQLSYSYTFTSPLYQRILHCDQFSVAPKLLCRRTSCNCDSLFSTVAGYLLSYPPVVAVK
jgi:hypothetical protein